jgi:hypothetical protein
LAIARSGSAIGCGVVQGRRTNSRPRGAIRSITAATSPLVERRTAGEQAMQDDAAGEHITLGGGALRAQGCGLDRHCRAVSAARRGGNRVMRLGSGDSESHHARLAPLVDQDVLQLQVEVGDAGVVAEGEAAQDARDPRGRVLDRRRRMLREPLVEGHAGAAIDGDVRPVIVDAALCHLGDVGMIQPRRAPRREKPVADARGTGRRQPRHRQQRLGSGAVVDREPDHRQLALREQAAQGEVAEGARRRRRADGRGESGRHQGTELA